jgi:predicted transcriptional regulator
MTNQAMKDLEGAVMGVVSQQQPLAPREVVKAVRESKPEIQPVAVETAVLRLIDRGQLALTKDLKVEGTQR